MVKTTDDYSLKSNDIVFPPLFLSEIASLLTVLPNAFSTQSAPWTARHSKFIELVSKPQTAFKRKAPLDEKVAPIR